MIVCNLLPDCIVIPLSNIIFNQANLLKSKDAKPEGLKHEQQDHVMTAGCRGIPDAV